MLGNICMMFLSECILYRDLLGNASLSHFDVLGSMMARTTQAALIWLQEEQSYLWRDAQRAESPILHEETDTWLQWVASHTSFSFQGREGQLTMFKETRPRGGEGYWYAYRRQGKRTVKKYTGR